MKKSGRNKTPFSVMMGVFLFFMITFGLGMLKPNNAQAALADHVVINEIQTSSGSNDGQYDDWVEFYNPTASAIDLGSSSIQKTSAAGTSLYRKALSGTIAAGGYFLIVRNHASTSQALKDAANVLAAGSSFSLVDNSIIYLVNNNEDIVSSSDPDIVDFVGLGSSSYFEGSGAAQNPPEGKSIARIPDGEDNNQNATDFVVQDIPTPKEANSGNNNENEISGTVELTITPDAIPVQNLNSTGADIVFQVNGNGQAIVNYGLTSAYGSSTAGTAVVANANKTISLTGLQCHTTYHYSIHAANTGATETDQTSDATFTTLPCGIALNSLTMTKTSAKANNNYSNGWEWQFDITVWNLQETNLKMKFDSWSGTGNLAAANNMQFSINGGTTWQDIASNGAYGAGSADISAVDNSTTAGRQVVVTVRMKVPVGTSAGVYNSNWGILTE
jgi:hypothetical protein